MRLNKIQFILKASETAAAKTLHAEICSNNVEELNKINAIRQKGSVRDDRRRNGQKNDAFQIFTEIFGAVGLIIDSIMEY